MQWRDGRAAVANSDQNSTPDDESSAGVDQLHLVLSPIEVDIIIDALRSVGNLELADRLETILRHQRRPPEP